MQDRLGLPACPWAGLTSDCPEGVKPSEIDNSARPGQSPASHTNAPRTRGPLTLTRPADDRILVIRRVRQRGEDHVAGGQWKKNSTPKQTGRHPQSPFRRPKTRHTQPASGAWTAPEVASVKPPEAPAHRLSRRYPVHKTTSTKEVTGLLQQVWRRGDRVAATIHDTRDLRILEGTYDKGSVAFLAQSAETRR
jgi:hypothetical protein